jgi:membrane-associated phospholipid phosphatase
MRDTRQQTLGFGLIAAGIAAAAGFIGTTGAVRRRRTHATDGEVRRRVPHSATPDTTRGRVVERAMLIGKWWVQGPATTIAAAALWRSGHRRAASALTLASASSALFAEGIDRTIFHRQPPPGHPKPDNPSYPSGHVTQLAAISLTAGYVLMREEIAPAAVTMPLAVGVPLVSSGLRMYQDRHWSSDIVGGWLAGLALASWSMAAYELVPERRLAEISNVVGERAHGLGRTVSRGATNVARESRRGARRAERVVTHAVERAADTVGRGIGRRSPGVLDIVKAFVEDVLVR